jgi:hypothetical protein
LPQVVPEVGSVCAQNRLPAVFEFPLPVVTLKLNCPPPAFNRRKSDRFQCGTIGTCRQTAPRRHLQAGLQHPREPDGLAAGERSIVALGEWQHERSNHQSDSTYKTKSR